MFSASKLQKPGRAKRGNHGPPHSSVISTVGLIQYQELILCRPFTSISAFVANEITEEDVLLELQFAFVSPFSIK